MPRLQFVPRALSLALPVVALLLGSASSLRGQTPAEVAERIRRVESGLLTYHVVRGETAPPLTIEDRLRFYRVPGVSVAVINNGRIEWARGWGEAEAGSGVAVDTATLFQAASISKPVTAVAALRLVQAGRLGLDEDVNRWLRSWQVPDTPFTAAEKVTLRRLLSHSAGTTVHGFPGYAAGDTVPTVVQVLTGGPPANTRPVRVDTFPGSLWRYSGGGYTIVQLLLTEVTGRPFAELMREQVLEPAGMRHSTFAQPLPAERVGRAATAHRGDGTAIPGKHHTYPEQAAAGLWTTPSDLARLAIEVQRAYNGEAGRIVTPETARLMLTPQVGPHGLGFQVNGEADSLWFEHGGSNEGFRTYFAALARTGQGFVIMTNGANGTDLALEILRSISREYGLAAGRPRERDAVPVDPAALAQLAGTYSTEETGARRPFVVELSLEGGVLRASFPNVGWRGRSLRASAPDTFFFLENPGELAFERDASGAVVALRLSGLGQPIRAVRR
ncbi:MAG TPA: serine hydrolase domain-containing protein [Longimicrobiaceae bacterium]|nr:serine hydrolase domain-containing protein [Longimicrobiaceae bacterium]